MVIEHGEMFNFSDLRLHVCLKKDHGKGHLSTLYDGHFLGLMTTDIPNYRKLMLDVEGGDGHRRYIPMQLLGRVSDNTFRINRVRVKRSGVWRTVDRTEVDYLADRMLEELHETKHHGLSVLARVLRFWRAR